MRIFVYEYITGGGLYLDGDQPPSGSMLSEGAAMVTSVSADFSAIPGVRVVALRDVRLGQDQVLPGGVECHAVADRATHATYFDRLAAESDVTLLIAPEIEGRLLQLTERAEGLGARLISPDANFVRLASDKLATTALLHARGVPVPVTYRCRTTDDAATLPASLLVRKPIDGAGSWQVCLTQRAELAEWLDGSQDVCVQEFCPGRAASVAGLCGGGRRPELLPPCWQWLEPPTFAYRGGEVIVARDLAERARRLASRALAALPPSRGYVGIDLVLGEPTDGSRDVVIEVNPRLTTSYVGLRRLAKSNLAEVMWLLATGTTANVTCRPRPLQFDTAGRVWSTAGATMV